MNTIKAVLTQGAQGPQGSQGSRGPALRGPQAWADVELDYQFYKGAEGEPYKDIVLYNGSYYSCKKSHVKTSANYPGGSSDTSNGYWQLADKVEMVAANVLFSEHGFFGDAIISGQWMISANGYIEGALYTKGQSFSGELAYNLFNADSPKGNNITRYLNTTTSIISSGTELNKDTVTLEAGRVYRLTCTGYTNNSNGFYYVRLVKTDNSSVMITPIYINGSSSVQRSGLAHIVQSGSYYIQLYRAGSYTGYLTSCKLEEVCFGPVYALNLRSGAVYQGDAHIRGVIDANLFYAKTRLVTESDYQINPETEPYSTFVYNEVSGYKYIRLPKAADYDGMEITIFIKSTQNYNLMDNGYRVAPKLNSGDSIFIKENIGSFKDIYNNYRSAQILSYEYYWPGGSVLLIANERYVFKSMLGAWYAIQGVFTGE